MQASASAAFRARFGAAVTRTFWAPGRVNLIGEHIDYCGGAVLPMPIAFGTRVEIALRSDRRLRIFSTQPDETLELDMASGAVLAAGFVRGHWGNYVRGVVAVLSTRGCAIPGADVLVTTDIPGSGLSSSASFTVALMSAFVHAVGHRLDGLPLARACRRVEHEFAGVQCGLMDQAVVVLGEADAALLFNCSDETASHVRLVGSRPEVLVIDTGKSRALAASAYNERLHETRRAATVLGIPHERLALADPSVLDRTPLDTVVGKRVRHIVTEHRRVLEAVRGIDNGDWPRVGTLFCDSHRSLQTSYEVTSIELDCLVDLAMSCNGVLGARMTGAGFGGAIVALVEPLLVAEVTARISERYRERFAITPRCFVAKSCGGAREVHD